MGSFKKFILEQQQISEGVDDQGIFKAVFLAGGPGSGKSFVAKNTLPNAIFGLKLVNSDEMLEFLLKKHGVSSNMNTMSPAELQRFSSIRNHAKSLTDKKEKMYIHGRLGLVIDGTGKDYKKIAEKKAELAALGYDTYMVFVNTSLEVAKERNKLRERSISDELVTQYWTEVQKNIGKFQDLFGGNNFVVVDNNKVDDVILNKVFKGIKKFVDMAPRSHIARAWIQQQKFKK